VAEWLKATDCKSVLFRVRRFESAPAHHCGNSSAGRALASQAKCREFESRFPLQVLLLFGQSLLVGPSQCLCSSVVEHSLGKGEVVSSILTTSSNVRNAARPQAGHVAMCLSPAHAPGTLATTPHRLILYGLLFLGKLSRTPEHHSGDGHPETGIPGGINHGERNV
jgi:hypothetical protein